MKKLFVFFAALLISASAFALTPAQDATLKTAMLAAPELAVPIAAGNDFAVAEWANATGTYIIWRSQLTPDLAREAIIQAAEQLDNLTVGKRDALLYLVGENLTLTSAVRSSIDSILGSQNLLKTAFAAIEKRPATKAESILAVGTGTTASPGNVTFEGFVTLQDVARILRGN